MLFDAIINLFKTICIGLVAFSPLIVYKALDDSSPNMQVVSSSVNDNGLDVNSQDQNAQNVASTGEQSQHSSSIFANSSNLFESKAPPPPPPPPVDAPIDDWIIPLLIIGAGYGFKRYRNNKSEIENKLMIAPSPPLAP